MFTVLKPYCWYLLVVFSVVGTVSTGRVGIISRISCWYQPVIQDLSVHANWLYYYSLLALRTWSWPLYYWSIDWSCSCFSPEAVSFTRSCRSDADNLRFVLRLCKPALYCCPRGSFMSVFNPRFLAACAVLLSPTQSVLLVLSALHFVRLLYTSPSPRD